MLKSKFIFVYLSLILFSSSIIINCSSDGIVSPMPVDSSDFRYPFKDGSRWSYTRTYSVSDIRPDSIRHYFTDYPITITGTTTILYDTIINSVVTKCFFDEFILMNTNRTNRFYYINNDTSLILFARRQNGPPTGLLPLKPINKNFLNIDNSSGNLEIVLLQDSLQSTLKYPMISGTEWTIYHSLTNNSTTIKYIGYENINIPVGTISCMKSSTTYSIFPDEPIYNYYSKFGLMKRHWFLNDVIFSTATNPKGIGTIDATDEIFVSSYHIPPD